MQAKQTKTKSGKVVFCVILESNEEANFSLFDNQGFCINCGEFTDGIEPDARKDTCESCDSNSVYGLEELLLMGYVSAVALPRDS